MRYVIHGFIITLVWLVKFDVLRRLYFASFCVCELLWRLLLLLLLTAELAVAQTESFVKSVGGMDCLLALRKS